MNLFAYQGKANDACRAPSPARPAVRAASLKGKGARTGARKADIKDFGRRQDHANRPETLPRGRVTWVLVDQISILDKESEEKHALAINEAKDTTVAQKLKYPDGTAGRGHGARTSAATRRTRSSTALPASR
jgi:hypothetical protein